MLQIRLASYKAHARTHAGNGQDGLDLVFKKICQETSSSVECRETRCKTRRSSGTGERARVVEEPHRVESQVSAVADVRQVADRQSSAVSSNGDVGSSLQSSGQGEGGLVVYRRLLKRPLIKQNIAGPLISQKQDPSVEVQTPVGADVTPQYASPSRSSKTRKPEVQKFDRSPVKGEVKRRKRLPVTTTKSGVLGRDSTAAYKVSRTRPNEPRISSGRMFDPYPFVASKNALYILLAFSHSWSPESSPSSSRRRANTPSRGGDDSICRP